MHQHINGTFSPIFFESGEPICSHYGFYCTHLLKNLLLGLVRLLTMAARKPVILCRLINEPINSKSATMNASIIAIIYCHLLCVNYLLGTGPVGSTEQGEKSSVPLKKENWSCKT